MKRYITALLLLITSICIYAHPIKMTTGKLIINTSAHSIELLVNFFIDDFEPQMLEMYPQLPFNYDMPDDIMKSSIQDYTSKNITIKTDNKMIPFTLSSVKRIESNVCQVTFTGTNQTLSSFKLLTIRNTLLFSSFSKQTNILHVIIDDSQAKILEFYPSDAVKIIKN